MRKIGWLVLIFLAVLSVRLVNLGNYPRGVWTDEIQANVAGLHYVDNLIKTGVWVPYSPEATGHPWLSLVFSGLSLKLWGNTIFGLRFASAFLGALSVVMFYLLAAEFVKNKTALTVTALMTFSYWHLSLSRIGFEATYYWFFECLTLLILVRYGKTGKLFYLPVLGLTLGLGIYTYLAFRTIAAGILIIAGWIALKRKAWVGSVLMVAFLGLTLLPLYRYSRAHPGEITYRSDDLSIFNPKFTDINRIKMIGENSLKAVGMLFWQGDPNLRHNMAQKPQLDPMTFVLFLAGVVVLLKEKRWGYLVVAAGLMGVGALNGILTYEPPYVIQPHSLRMLGMLPIIYLIVAKGLERVGKLKIVIVLVAAVVLINSWWYFGTRPSQKLLDAFGYYQNNQDLFKTK